MCVEKNVLLIYPIIHTHVPNVTPSSLTGKWISITFRLLFIISSTIVMMRSDAFYAIYIHTTSTPTSDLTKDFLRKFYDNIIKFIPLQIHMYA